MRRAIGLKLYDLLHHLLPSPRSGLGVSDHEVGARDLDVDGGLALCLVPRMEEPLGLDAVFGAKGFLLSGLIVVDVVDGSPAIHPVFVSDAHNGFGYER